MYGLMTVLFLSGRSGGLIEVHLPPDRAVRVQALAGDIVNVCSWATLFTLTVPLSTEVYK